MLSQSPLQGWQGSKDDLVAGFSGQTRAVRCLVEEKSVFHPTHYETMSSRLRARP